jgi:capsule biosynthesis phosphatase
MNIVIPLGGLGERFLNEGYHLPKPLIKILGKSMIQHVIDNLTLQPYDNLIIIYNKCLNKNDFDKIIKQEYDNVYLIELNFQTEGAVQTILYGLKFLEKTDVSILKKKYVILDGDTIYNTDILNTFRSQINNAIYCFEDENEKPIYSYIKIDENNVVIDIKEKCKISNIANTGCYCFEDGNILKFYCEKIISENIREKNEYYTSCVIKEMIKDNKIFEANIINKSDFDCVGTPFQLKMYAMKNQIKEHSLKRLCFDLDNTLVTFPEIKNDYSSVKPINKNIEMLRKLKSVGNTIIIYTARRMKTHNGNIGKINRDIGKITLDTLEKFDIPYDELYFGKPYADFYIDDLAVNACENLEKATGFYHEFIQERSFNKIETVNNKFIKKTSSDCDGLAGEIYFYKNVPQKIKHYFPKLIENYNNTSFLIEKINGINLSRFFTSELLTHTLLLKLLDTIKFIHSSYTFDKYIENVNIYANYAEKIRSRYNNYDYKVFKNDTEIYKNILEFLIDYEKNKKGLIGLIHGDPVFSNIIITEDENFKFIDMRGKLGNELSIFGDIFYDYAKILQSIIGYDEIVLNENVENKYRSILIKTFNKFIVDNFGEERLYHVKMITYSLLFSLIPLHNDEKIFKYFDLIAL